jgi:hypothetical protein
MDGISIGMKATRAEQLGHELANAARNAIDRSADGETPARFEVTLESRNNDGGEQVIITIGNDDMERGEVTWDEVYVEVDE